MSGTRFRTRKIYANRGSWWGESVHVAEWQHTIGIPPGPRIQRLQTNCLEKRSKTLNPGFAKMAVFDQNGTAGSGMSKNRSKMRFFAPYSSARPRRFLPAAESGGLRQKAESEQKARFCGRMTTENAIFQRFLIVTLKISCFSAK